MSGFRMRFGEGDNQGSDAVFLTRIDEAGEYRQVDTLLTDAVQ